MRIAGFIALTLFLPAFASAAPPMLTTYTVSNSTLYPGASSASGLATTTSIDTAFSESVKVSIKVISTTDTTIKSLYTSSGVTNPAPKVWDGTNTAGTYVDNGSYTILIAATSTATGLALNDSSKTITVASSDTQASPDTSADLVNTPPVSTGPPPEYIPVPVLTISTTGNRTVSSGADTAFTTVVYDSRGNKRDEAIVTWSFGDGMRKVGASVYHEYYDPGEYLAVVRAMTSDGGNVQKEIVVTVKDANIKITGVTSRGIALTNSDSRTLDISLWKLSAGGQEFKIPEDTQILAGHTVLFSSKVIELPTTDTAFLLYPSGEVAATFGASVPVQPQPVATSYEQVQKVEPITSPKEYVPVYEKAVIAPAAANELAAAGAALAPPTLSVGAPTSDVGAAPVARSSNILKSPWTLGFIGTVLLAGGAFILL